MLIAASSQRRGALASMATRSTHARITTNPAISLERIFQASADVIIVDADGPSMSAGVIQLAEALPGGAGLIALADNPDSQWVTTTLRLGINAILSRDVTFEELRLAIQAAESGLVLLHPSSAQSLRHRHFNPDHDSSGPVEALTGREQEVLRLVSEGLGNKEIAVKLNISDHTVKFHISSILSKLGAASRTEAVSQGIRRGFITV